MLIQKPNQEKEKAELERVIEEKYGFPCKVTIFAEVLPEPTREAQWRRFFYRFKQHPIRELKKVFVYGLSDSYKEPVYNQILITASSRYASKFYDVKSNGLFEKYGIRNGPKFISEEADSSHF